MPSHAINTWFVPIVPIEINNEKISLSVPNQFFLEWIESHYSDQLLSAVRVALKNEQAAYHLLVTKEQKAVVASKPVSKPKNPPKKKGGGVKLSPAAIVTTAFSISTAAAFSRRTLNIALRLVKQSFS